VRGGTEQRAKLRLEEIVERQAEAQAAEAERRAPFSMTGSQKLG
jgi:hypothetical protein